MSFLRSNAGYVTAVIAGVLLFLAYFFIRSEWWIAIFAFVLILYGVSAGTLTELSIGWDGILAKFQRQVLHELERLTTESLTIGDRADAKVTRGGSISSDAAIGDKPKTPEEFADIIANQIVRPETARMKLDASPPNVTVEPNAGAARGSGDAHDASVPSDEDGD